MPKSAGGPSGKRGALATKAPEDAPDAMRALFGENFHTARIKCGLTQNDIEALTGIKQAYISQIECGRQNPTLATMVALALAVEKPIHQLLKPPAARGNRKRAISRLANY